MTQKLIVPFIIFIAILFAQCTDNKTINFKIDPPLNGIDVPFLNYKVIAEKGAIYTHPSGSIIQVPPNAFVDANGNLIKGKINLKYREFNSPTDIYLAGIPMGYIYRNKNYTFESAAMSEIYAMQDSTILFINPENKIMLFQKSITSSENFDLYRFDTTKGAWIDKGKDVPVVKIDTNVALLKLLKPTVDKKSSLPLKPRKANPKNASFIIEVEKGKLPELDAFKNVIFEIDKDDPSYHAKSSEVIWNDVDIIKGNKEGTYKVTFSKGEFKKTYVAYPVFADKDYKNAVNVYENKLESYNKKKKDRIAKEEAIKKERIAAAAKRKFELDSINQAIEARNIKIRAYNKKIDSLQKERAKALEAIKKRQEIENNIYRSYQIDGFGIWNVDALRNDMNLASLEVSFLTPKGEEHYETINLIIKGENGIIKYSPYQFKKFKYNKDKHSVIWTLSRNNELLYFNKFNNLNGKKEVVIQLEKINGEFFNYEEIKKILDRM